MKRSILIILFILLPLIANDENWIDPNKKAILLDYAQDITEAKTIAKEYKDHDIYIYNTIQNSNACCAIHIVNIKKTNVKSLLKKVKQNNLSAKEISTTRIKYFARDMSPKNLFIESGTEDTIEEKIQDKIIDNKIEQIAQKQVIQNNLSQDIEESWIDPTKRIILVDYVKNPKEANLVAQKYKNQDVYIRSTVKNREACCVVYIVNIKKQNVKSILKLVSKNTKNAKKVSIAKVKYFAADISPINKFIAASNVENNINKTITVSKEIKVIPKIEPIAENIILTKTENKEIVKKEVIKPKNKIESKAAVVSKEIKVTPKIEEKPELVSQKIEPVQKLTVETTLTNPVKTKRILKEEVIERLAERLDYIDINKKAITLVSSLDLERALKIAKTLSKYDIYIYKTTSTQTPYFILYAVNITRDNRNENLQDIRKILKDAYFSSNAKIKYLASNTFNKNLFIRSSLTSKRPSEVSLVNSNYQMMTVKYDYRVPIIRMKKISIVKPKKVVIKQIKKQVVEKKIVQQEKVIITGNNNFIDINKKAVTIVSALSLRKAKELAGTLSRYDIYIYKTTTTRVPYFILYAVNIEKDTRDADIEDIRKKFEDAYFSSNTRIKSLASNNFDKNIFIPSYSK
ncbi:MAG: hypothetical protein KAQ94_05665 [Arcobacteraceae bacterium]|nr:hypothetical protein [Arcobacteraceae bacterium]